MPGNRIGLSVIIPAFNAGGWLVRTVDCIDAALKKTNFIAEIIVVNDGSTDDTLKEVDAIARQERAAPLHLIDQDNQGRYLARKVGVNKAKYDTILFIDSRVFISEKSLQFLEKRLKEDPLQVWNGHVYVAKQGNIFARFWDAIVSIAWRRYFRSPKECTFGIEDFDYYPKGTGFFAVPKIILREAMEYFEKTSSDLRFSSDDTLLIRYIATHYRIHLSPEFSCLYHGRTSMKGFLRHAYNRGQFFVDGFLRKGTRFFLPLVAFLIACPVLAVLIVAYPPVLLLGIFAWLLGLVAAIVLGAQFKDSLALFLLSPLFALVYGAGIWRAVIRRVTR